MGINIGISNGIGFSKKVSGGSLPLLPKEILDKINCIYLLKGYTNEQLQSNPIIKDLSGKKNDLTLDGFSFSEDSGMKEDALYFDGIDDRAIVPDVNGRTYKAVTLVCNPIVSDAYLFGQNSLENDYSIYNGDNSILAYQAKNKNGVTYINEIRNEHFYPNDLLGKPQIITSIFPATDSLSTIPCIGCNWYLRQYGKMALYSFIGWIEEPTEEERQIVISTLNLDEPFKPTIFYSPKQQGLTNESSEWKLKDLSGNGHDATLYNFAKTEMSGMGGFIDFYFRVYSEFGKDFEYNISDKLHITKILGRNKNSFLIGSSKNQLTDYALPIRFRILINSDIKIGFTFRYSAGKKTYRQYCENGITYIDIPFVDTGVKFVNPQVYLDDFLASDLGDCDITIEQLPLYPDALVTDGIDDFAIVDSGIPILNDCTIISKRRYINIESNEGGLYSDLPFTSSGSSSVVFESYNRSTGHNKVYFKSFGEGKDFNLNNEKISYATKYNYNGTERSSGQIPTRGQLGLFWTATYPSPITVAFYNFLLFPYSLNKFLIDRQIAKYKLDDVAESIEVKEVSIVSTLPTKIEYNVGETFDSTGMVVTLIYNNGVTKTLLSSEYTLSGFDSSTAGTKTITITYGEFTTSFSVKIVEDPNKYFNGVRLTTASSDFSRLDTVVFQYPDTKDTMTGSLSAEAATLTITCFDGSGYIGQVGDLKIAFTELDMFSLDFINPLEFEVTVQDGNGSFITVDTISVNNTDIDESGNIIKTIVINNPDVRQIEVEADLTKYVDRLGGLNVGFKIYYTEEASAIPINVEVETVVKSPENNIVGEIEVNKVIH